VDQLQRRENITTTKKKSNSIEVIQHWNFG